MKPEDSNQKRFEVGSQDVRAGWRERRTEGPGLELRGELGPCGGKGEARAQLGSSREEWRHRELCQLLQSQGRCAEHGGSEGTAG